MKLEGSFNIAASRQAVWDFMIDPMAIGGCAPGVGTVEIVIPEKKFQTIVSAGFGGAFATFKTEVEFIELNAPVSAKFTAHGVASNGAVDAISEMTLVEAANGTTDVKWMADVTVVGALASLAARLMDTITRRMTAEFFACMQRQLNVRQAAALEKEAKPDGADAKPSPVQPPAVPELSTTLSAAGPAAQEAKPSATPEPSTTSSAAGPSAPEVKPS
jgi:uncharacterized protein